MTNFTSPFSRPFMRMITALAPLAGAVPLAAQAAPPANPANNGDYCAGALTAWDLAKLGAIPGAMAEADPVQKLRLQGGTKILSGEIAKLQTGSGITVTMNPQTGNPVIHAPATPAARAFLEGVGDADKDIQALDLPQPRMPGDYSKRFFALTRSDAFYNSVTIRTCSRMVSKAP